MKYSHIIIPLLSLGLFSCAVKQTPVSDVIIPKAPPIAESISPSIEKLAQSNQKMDDKIKEQSKTISEQNLDILDAINKAEKLKAQLANSEQIKEQDASDLVQNLKTVHTRNLFLESQNSELLKIKNDQATELLVATKKAADKDNEASVLRAQNTDKDTIILKQNDNLKTIAAERDKAVKLAASAKVYRNWIWGIAIGFILLTILRNVLMAYGVKVRI